jgi:DNA-binding CsgD family transcriptional regulator
MRLSHRDVAALQRTILELYAYRDLETFRRAVPDLFLKVIPADYFGLAEIDFNLRARVIKARGCWESSPRMTQEVTARMERQGFNHPFSQYSLRTKDPSALKISDFLSLRQFRDSELYCEFYRHAGIVRLLAIAAFGSSGMTTLNAARGARDRDFSDRDRQIMNLLRPHFDQARRNAELATARRAAQAKPLETYDLTPRETQIAHWLGQGKTNAEIAVIVASRVRTVEKHVQKILGKLEVENRTAAAVIIVQANGSGKSHD